MTLSMQLPTAPAQLEITDDFAHAIAAVARLCPEDQNFLAFRIMEEIAEEQKWAESFDRSLGMMDKLATEARQDVAEGRAAPLKDIL